MFEGKLKVGKSKETPKDREFFLMNEKQDDIQIHPDSEERRVERGDAGGQARRCGGDGGGKGE